MKPAVLMGDPTYFQIQAGPNPFTRNRWGMRKKVNRDLAIKQWRHLAGTLTELGVEVYVMPPQKKAPGLVYPANAGIVTSNGTFLLSHLLPARAIEEPYYKSFLSQLGFETASVSARFEGEADLATFKNKMIFTYGKLETQRFAWHCGFPPWKRIYGFRSDIQVQTELETWFPEKEWLALELVDESFYHGDTCLCVFGENHLLVYLKALSSISQNKLRSHTHPILLSEEDAKLYAANSFYVTVEKKKVLIMPEGVSNDLLKTIRGLEVEPLLVDVSEFWKKGGGSVKCMIGNLGLLPSAKNKEIESFRQSHLFKG